ncbi:class I adenylate-forming enzyme family protein [Mycobacterium sp. NPDC003449]
MRPCESTDRDTDRGTGIVDAARFYGTTPGFRERVAIVLDDRRVTFGELWDRSERLADGLGRRWGLQPGDVVAMLAKNSVELIETIYACAILHIALAPVSYRSTASELLAALEVSGARAIIVDDEFRPVLDAVKDRVTFQRTHIAVLGEPSAEFTSYAELVDAGQVPRPPARSTGADAVLWIGLTGGTTGRPKACVCTQAALVQNWLAMTIEIGIGRGDVELIGGPFYHGLGFVFGLQQLYVGGCVVVMRDFDPAAALEALAQHGVTVVPMPPTMHRMMMQAAQRSSACRDSMRTVVTTSAPITPADRRELETFYPNAGLYNYYGSTELGFATLLRPEDPDRVRDSVGRPWLGSTIQIMSRDGSLLAPGEVGLVCKRGQLLASHYLDNPTANADMWIDGWATVGDIGFVDTEGYLHLVARENDVIITGGVNVYPSEVELVIAELPEVTDVAVVGLPDPLWGQRIHAVVVLHDAAVAEPDDIIDACASRLAGFKRPRGVDFWPELPRNPVGKLLRARIVEQLQSPAQTAIR